MAATRYIVFTNNVHAADYARKDRAIAEAEKYIAAAQDMDTTQVIEVITTAGKWVFGRTVNDVPAIPAVSPVAKKARRATQGASVVDGWELLYDKPKQNAQVVRNDLGYGLACTTHKTVRVLVRLVEERALRQNGGWCHECTAAH